MKAKYIGPSNCCVTFGKVYDVQAYAGYYHITDDVGDRSSYHRDQFEVIPDEPSAEPAATTNVVDRPKFKPGDKVRLREFAYGTNVKASVSYGSTETIREVFKVQDNLDGKTQHLHVQHLGTGMSSLWFDLVEAWDPAKAPAPHGADTKPSNPKDVIGSTKPPLSCIPTGPLYEVGAVMLDGSAKYGRHNWRVIGVRSSVYYDAALRHLMKWWEGEELDTDSGCHHLAHAVACCLIVRDAANLGQLTDDRPVPGGDPTAGVKDLIKQIKERYPEPVPPFLASQK